LTAVTINLVKYSAVTCVASSEFDDSYKCQNAYDGTEVSTIGHHWASCWEGIGAWIKVKRSWILKIGKTPNILLSDTFKVYI